MNLLKKNKYSIRKYKVGIFSTLIGTVLLLSNPNGAQALTTDQNVQGESNQALPGNSHNTNVDTSRDITNSSQNTPNQHTTANASTNQALANHHNVGESNQVVPMPVQPSTSSASNNNHSDAKSTATESAANTNNNLSSNNNTLNVPNNTDNNDSARHLTLKEIQEDVRHSSDKPELVAIAEEASNRPKKRSRRAAPADPNATPADPTATPADPAAGNGSAPVAITAPYTPTTDPNANNIGQNAPNEVLSFDDNGIRPSTNRSVPTVTVVDNLPGFTLINGGKVGVFSHAMVRTSMFDSGDAKNYQAQGNVIALGRIRGNDVNDHGDFNGIEKTLTVNPNSELIFEFNTMTTKNYQGMTNLVIKNADNDAVIGEKVVAYGPIWRLFKVPENVSHLKIQFVPKNDAITDPRGIYQLRDGYKYYDFVDSIGLHSGSHVYVERRTMEPTATNNKEFSVTTSLKNNGNFGASFNTDDFVYKIQLPEGVEYVNNSLTKDFQSGNSGVDINDFNVTYDAANRIITIKSTGGGSGNSPARLMPDKILDLKYKLRVNNVPTPRTVTFNDTLTYKTFSQDFINSPAESHTVSTEPYTIDIIMNKDALQAEVDRRIQQADYTFASLDIFNDLKRRAQTILDENRNNVPLNKRVSQADIDSLANQMQHTLIRSVDAENAVNRKVDDMEDLVNQNDELTDEEKQAAIQVIEEHKNEIIGNIGDQTTDDGVTRIKDQGIQTLSRDTATPVVKPNAKQAIRDKAAKQREIINNTPDATQDEIQDALNQLTTDETDAIDNVTNATTNADVETAKNNGINTIGAVVPQVTHKQAARDAINQATATKRQQINSNREATQEEKNAALNELTQATNHALEQINQATTNDDVDTAKGDGLNAINPIAPVTVVKQAARDAVSHDAQQHIAEINANPDATQEERQAAIDKVNAAVAAANANILNANTNADVEQVKTNAIQGIQAIEPATKVKTDAKNAIDQSAETQHNAIFNNNDATLEEQQAAQQLLDQAVATAKQNINAADTNQEVAQAKDQGMQNIVVIQPATQVKTDARNTVNEKAREVITNINATPGATREEKQEAIDRVNALKNRALTDIGVTSTTAMVNSIRDDAVNQIGAVQPHVTKKQTATGVLNDLATAKKQEINQNTNATTEEKQIALNQVDQELAAALNNINQADTNAEVDQAQQLGAQAINAIQPNIVKKPAALAQINQHYNAKLAEINATPDATDDEKNAAINTLNQDRQQAIESLNQANTNNEVDQAAITAENNIDAVQVDVVKKQAARDKITAEVAKRIEAVKQTPNATDEEKQVALNQLANNEKRALQNIDQAIANNDVKRVESNGIATLKGVEPHIVVKPEAQQAIKASADNQVESIKDTPHATTDELDEANQQINDTLKQGQQDIDNTTQDVAVNDVRNQTIKAIEQIKPKVRRKRAALDNIDESNNNQLDAIRNTLDTTQDERNIAIAELNKIVNTIKNDIAQNKTNAEVDQTEADGNNNIKVILPKVQVKPAARHSVSAKAEAQNALIDQSDLSTEEERLAAKHLVDQALNQAIDQINHADKTAQVNQNSIDAQKIISQIKPATTVKTTALQQIQNIATNKINLIKANNEATDEEQNAAIAQVEQALIKAKQQIASAVTNADVAYLLHDGKNEIREIEPVINRKSTAREQLTTLLNDKKQAIEANVQATVEERNSILAQLQNIYDTAIGQIDQDRSNAQVDKTASLNLQTIHDLDVHPIKKPDAEKTINDDLARVTHLVQNYRKVSDRNKADALKAITALKLQMDEELKIARTNADVDAVLKRFKVALGDIEAVITEKENSLLRIDNIAQQTYAKFKSIATPEQLAKVKALIDQYVADGNRMIDEDATLNDIKQHTQFIVDEILAIKLPAEVTNVSPKVGQPAPKVCTPIKKEDKQEVHKVEKELPNTGSEEMDLPLKELALITGAALLARRRTKNEKES